MDTAPLASLVRTLSTLAQLVAPALSGLTGLIVLGRALPDSVRVGTGTLLLVAIGAAASWGVLVFSLRPLNRPAVANTLIVTGVAAGLATMAACALYETADYLRLPVDLLSFSESSFVNDIIKVRSGSPIFTPAADNSAYPYMPGTQLLTYAVASLFGLGESISAWRVVQYTYVVLAALLAGWSAVGLGRLLKPDLDLGNLPAWFVAASSAALLVTGDRQFNGYTHTLHNDGLALLISVASFAVLVEHARAPRRWTLVAMAMVPGLGFAVKQSLVAWALLAAAFLVWSGTARWRTVALVAGGALALVMGLVWWGGEHWGGDAFRFWIFEALGQKHVSLARSARNLLSAGIYACFLALAAWSLLARGGNRRVVALWLVPAGLFVLEGYTSGIGFVRNHLGPGTVLATSWLFAVVIAHWPFDGVHRPTLSLWGRVGLATLSVIAIFPGMGLFPEPRRNVPADFHRYVADIEREFAGQNPERVLLDMGSWPYLSAGIVMKDRADPVALHAGENQPEIGHAYLASTIERFRSGYYDKLLIHGHGTRASAYDFRERGTGIPAAIDGSYRVVRTIPAVDGVEVWWPRSRIGDIVVLERRDRAERE
jgi:hypothetical protein